MFHPQTAFFLTGALYIALPLTAWSILRRRHDGRSVALWCIGGGALGLGTSLIGLRDVVPDWISFVLANALIFASYPLRALSLQRELGAREEHALAWMAWIAPSVVYLALLAFTTTDPPRVILSAVENGLGAAALAWLSWRLFRLKGYRSAAMLSVAYGLFALSMLVRGAVFATHMQQLTTFSPGWPLTFAFVAAIIAALYGNLGYVGIALESAREVELARAMELSREQEKRKQIELHSRELSALLEERTQLLTHREEMLGVLAHEVRQPLNNASAALQSAAAVLGRVNDEQGALARLQRANAVLMQVSASLDNALADAVLLDGPEPMDRQDMDVDTLIDMVLVDIAPQDRKRVRVERSAAARTAELNPSLMRLALRNLIANALAYSPAGSPVTVHIRDMDAPLGLSIDICDQGPGFEPELVDKLFSRGKRGTRTSQPGGHGLGLHIVRRVMQMHGGTAQLAHNAPGEAVVMRLTLPHVGV